MGLVHGSPVLNDDEILQRTEQSVGAAFTQVYRLAGTGPVPEQLPRQYVPVISTAHCVETLKTHS